MRTRILTYFAGVITAAVVSCSTMHNKTLEQLENPARITRVFVFDAANAAQYPVCHASFINALHAWANVLPMHFAVTYDTRVWGVRVLFADIDKPPFDNPTAVGLWYENWPTGLFQSIPLIVIDSDEMENDRRPTKLGLFAKNTAMHEIGHMLGLEHVNGPGTAYHGGLIVESQVFQEQCIMCPYNTHQQEIQPVEIALVREKLGIPPELWHHKGYVTVFMPPDQKVPPNVDGRDSKGPSKPK